MKIQVRPRAGGLWAFRLVGGDGNPIGHPDGVADAWPSRADAVKAGEAHIAKLIDINRMADAPWEDA